MNNELTELYKEYEGLMIAQQMGGRQRDAHKPNGLPTSTNPTTEQGLAEAIVQQHIEALQASAVLCNLAITLYDNHRREHVYVSDYQRRLFSGTDGEMEVHPGDLPDVMKNAIATMRHVFNGNKNIKHIKVVREYRAKLGDKFRRVTESVQVLETDQWGNAWLVLCILEISPNQAPPFIVNSHIVNTETGEVFSPLTQHYKDKSILTKRELEILTLIAQGKLSKEISELLHISVNTANTHRQHILEKLGVDNSHEAVRYALSLGLIDLGS